VLGGNPARAASAWEHRVECAASAHQADTGRGPSASRPDISRQVAEREPGAHKDPGWFINRSPTIALQRVTVQADDALLR